MGDFRINWNGRNYLGTRTPGSPSSRRVLVGWERTGAGTRVWDFQGVLSSLRLENGWNTGISLALPEGWAGRLTIHDYLQHTQQLWKQKQPPPQHLSDLVIWIKLSSAPTNPTCMASKAPSVRFNWSVMDRNNFIINNHDKYMRLRDMNIVEPPCWWSIARVAAPASWLWNKKKAPKNTNRVVSFIS